MKVLFIAGRYPTPENRVLGPFIRDHALAASLYHEVAVIYGYKDRGQKEIYRFLKEKEGRIPIIRFTYRKPLLAWDSFSTYVEGVHQAFQQLRDEGFSPDMVHANIFFTAVPANLIKQRYKIPFVITEHRSVFLSHLLNKTDLKRAFTMQESTRIMPVSNTLQKGIEAYGIKGQFEVVPNTIDMNIFYPNVRKEKGEGVKNILSQTMDYMIDNFLKYDPSIISRYARENFSYQEVGKRLTRIYHEAEKIL